MKKDQVATDLSLEDETEVLAVLILIPGTTDIAFDICNANHIRVEYSYSNV